ncbi:MAG: EAL domain-containing protein [Pseudomonadota bacterium]|nr:EAL domain-containing protein [Pseudomonadota bacterium]
MAGATDDRDRAAFPRTVAVVVLLAILGSSLIAAHGLYQDRNRERQSLEHSTGILARAIALTISHRFDHYIASLAAVAGASRDPARDLVGIVGTGMAAVTHADPAVVQTFLLDDRGNMRVGNPGSAVDAAALRSHFSGVTPPPEPPGSPPDRIEMEQAQFGAGAIVVTRRLDAQSANPGGTVGLVLDVSVLKAEILDLLPPGNNVIALFRDDGMMLMRLPDPMKVAGESFRDYPLFRTHLQASGAGTFVAPAQSDGHARLVSYTRVDGLPLVLAVAASGAIDAWPEWRAVLHELAEFSLVIAGLLGATIVLVRRTRQVIDSHLAGNEDNARLAVDLERSAAVIDALPAHISVLDRAGNIIAINQRWRKFAIANDYHGSSVGLNVNYIDICEGAEGPCAEEAAVVATGLRDLLGGRRDRFEIEYPCHSPDQKRWFRLVASRLDRNGQVDGAVVMHVDMTDRTIAENALHGETSRLRRLTSALPGVTFQVSRDRDGAYVWSHLDAKSATYFGRTFQADTPLKDLFREMVEAAHREHVTGAFASHLDRLGDLDMRIRIRSGAGKSRWMRLLAHAADGGASEGRVVSDGIFLDIDDHVELESRLSHLESHDRTTGLRSRDALVSLVRNAWSQKQSPKAYRTAFLVDIDDFSDINRVYGRALSDNVLKEVGLRLSSGLAQDDLIGRIGGDLFGVLPARHLDPEECRDFARTLGALFHDPVRVPGETISLTVNIGIAQAAPDEVDPEELLSHAEGALRSAKAAGNDNISFESDRYGIDTVSRVTVRNNLSGALDRGELALHLQPKLGLPDGQVTGAEALLRWEHPVFGLQSPAKFVPIAEQSGLIIPIGKWVIEETCRHIRRARDLGHTDLRISCNLSAVQARRTDIAATIERALSATGIPPESLEIELTEALAFDVSLLPGLKRIRDIGVSISIDDFGTGFSSLGYLKKFPMDTLKIDQSFVRGLPGDGGDRLVVEAIMSLARGLGLNVIAEGVDSHEQITYLDGLGCQAIQGYFVSPPLEAEDFLWFVDKGYRKARKRTRAALGKVDFEDGEED